MPCIPPLSICLSFWVVVVLTQAVDGHGPPRGRAHTHLPERGGLKAGGEENVRLQTILKEGLRRKILSSISAESTLNVSGHHIRNGHLFAGAGRGITTQRALHLRDWKKIGNNDEVVGNKIEEGMNQGKKLLRGGGQEDGTTIPAKEWNKNYEKTTMPLSQDEGLRAQSVAKHATGWMKDEKFVLQELPEQQQFRTYRRALAHHQSQQRSYGAMLHPEEVNNPLPLSSYPRPAAFEKELEEFPPNQVDKGRGATGPFSHSFQDGSVRHEYLNQHHMEHARHNEYYGSLCSTSGPTRANPQRSIIRSVTRSGLLLLYFVMMLRGMTLHEHAMLVQNRVGKFFLVPPTLFLFVGNLICLCLCITREFTPRSKSLMKAMVSVDSVSEGVMLLNSFLLLIFGKQQKDVMVGQLIASVWLMVLCFTFSSMHWRTEA